MDFFVSVENSVVFFVAVGFSVVGSEAQCLERWEKVIKLGLRKGPWTPAEDEIVKKALEGGSRLLYEVHQGRFSKSRLISRKGGSFVEK